MHLHVRVQTVEESALAADVSRHLSGGYIDGVVAHCSQHEPGQGVETGQVVLPANCDGRTGGLGATL